MNEEKRFFWFSSHDSVSGEKTKHLQLHRVRDGAAFQELATIAFNTGYSYGDLLFNIPGNKSLKDSERDWEGLLRPNDLLIMPTRPPLDDPRDRTRSRLFRSGSWLEKTVMHELETRCFGKCSRKRVTLARPLQEQLPPQYEGLGEIDFFQYEWPAYQTLLGDRKNPRRSSEGPTAGYLVFLKSIWKDGPDLLAAFGMSGTATLIWANLLRTQWESTVRQVLGRKDSAIIVAELNRKPTATTGHPSVVPSYPRSMEFTNDFNATLILDTNA